MGRLEKREEAARGLLAKCLRACMERNPEINWEITAAGAPASVPQPQGLQVTHSSSAVHHFLFFFFFSIVVAEYSQAELGQGDRIMQRKMLMLTFGGLEMKKNCNVHVAPDNCLIRESNLLQLLRNQPQ